MVAVPSGVVTVMVPVVAPLGTVVEMRASESTENVAAVPLNATEEASVKPSPMRVTAVPTRPVAGSKLATAAGMGRPSSVKT